MPINSDVPDLIHDVCAEQCRLAYRHPMNNAMAHSGHLLCNVLRHVLPQEGQDGLHGNNMVPGRLELTKGKCQRVGGSMGRSRTQASLCWHFDIPFLDLAAYSIHAFCNKAAVSFISNPLNNASHARRQALWGQLKSLEFERAGSGVQHENPSSIQCGADAKPASRHPACRRHQPLVRRDRPRSIVHLVNVYHEYFMFQIRHRALFVLGLGDPNWIQLHIDT